jgi:hypothetical protein
MFIIFGLNSESIISQSLGFISGKKHLLQSVMDVSSILSEKEFLNYNFPPPMMYVGYLKHIAIAFSMLLTTIYSLLDCNFLVCL